MGFMSQFKQQQPQRSSLSDLISTAKQIVGNDPNAALQHMIDNGMTCNLPDGRVMSVAQLASMANGKTPQQFLQQLGM